MLEGEVARHVELETLLRSTLVSAERASQDMKEQARREADVIVQEANAEGRRLLREAIAERSSCSPRRAASACPPRGARDRLRRESGRDARPSSVSDASVEPPAEARIERLAG